MKRLLPLIGLFIIILSSCEYDGTPRPDEEEKEKDDTTYTVTEPSDGSIATGVSGTLPVFMKHDEANRRLTFDRDNQINLYEFENIRRIDLTFSTVNWAQTLLSYDSGSDELPATVSLDGVSLPYKAGVRYKGNTSLAEQGLQKQSYNISIDFVNENQLLQGYNTVVLNGANQDRSFLREVVYRHCISKFIPASQVNYVNLYINGENQGLYANTQHINAVFLKEWFLSSGGTRWRAEPDESGETAPAGLYGTGFSGLNYLGEDPKAYSPYYDVKKSHKENVYLDIISVARILEKASPDTIESAINKVLDLDRTLWFLACENIFTDEDSYVHKGGTDYYLYWESETGRLVPIEYDGIDTFSPQNVNWDPFYHADDPRFPLLYKLLNVPSIRQRYLAHYRTILKDVYNPEFMNSLIDDYAAKIDSYIKDDPKKKMTYEDFKASVAEIKSVVNQRYQLLSMHDSVAVTGLEISNVKWQIGNNDWLNPGSTDTVLVTANITGGGVSSAYLCAATGLVGGFKRLQMFDDGTHGDKVAGDKVFSAKINPQSAGVRVRFYIEAVRGNASRTRTYFPSGAEHDVFTYIVK